MPGTYLGSVLAPNGKIYAAPYHGEDALVIHITDRSVSRIATSIIAPCSASALAAGSCNLWLGSVLTPQGKIYGIPAEANAVLIINTATDSISSISVTTGAYKWGGGVLGPTNGNSGVCVPSFSIQ
eukprot:g23579.t1